MVIQTQEKIDGFNAEDLINISEDDLIGLENKRINEIRRGSR